MPKPRRSHTMRWRPVVTPDLVADPSVYEYSPEAIVEPDGVTRLWATVGLGDDTLSTIRLDGEGAASWKLPDPTKLVADPSVLVYGDRYLVAFTVGDKVGVGTNNGISAMWVTESSNHSMIFGQPFTLIPQSGGHGTYGIGQPSMAARPGCPTVLLYTDTRDGRNRLRANHLAVPLDLRSGGPITIGPELAIPVDDDGASCTAWWDPGGRLHVAIVGDGRTGIRSFAFHEGAGELLSLGRAPGGFWTSVVVDTPGAIDGAGVLRGRDCQPVVTAGRLEAWQGAGNPADPASWGLHRFTLPAP